MSKILHHGLIFDWEEIEPPEKKATGWRLLAYWVAIIGGSWLVFLAAWVLLWIS